MKKKFNNIDAWFHFDRRGEIFRNRGYFLFSSVAPDHFIVRMILDTALLVGICLRSWYSSAVILIGVNP
jgi:hypothetical protein